MKKKLLFITLLLLICLTTGCFKRDIMEDINIITTAYPIEYVTQELYGEHAIVNSIYPDGTNINKYKFKKKQLNDYSKNDMFIYIGLSDDKDIALDLLNRNNNILPIDCSFGMELQYGIEELWLNPSNLLMISQNIKNGLQEYIDSSYLNKDIDKQYEDLKLKLSELDAEIKLTATNSSIKTLIVSNDAFKFLEKYGFQIISLDPDTATEKTVSDASELINNGTNKHIFFLENDQENPHIKNLEQNTTVDVITFKNLSNITDEERNNSYDYIKLMNDNLELIKKETYR